MWKIFYLLVFLLSADAQRLKLSSANLREGIEISEFDDIADEISYRLPNKTKPELYTITLELGDFHTNDLEFSGSAWIAIRVVESTDTIVLHSAVDVIGTSLSNERNIPISHAVSYDSDREFMIIKSGSVLAKDALVQLRVEYTGTIRSSVMGVYRGSYMTKDNERRFGRS